MKVKAPVWIYDTEDKNSQFFICLAYKIAKEHGFRSSYYMHGGDIEILFHNKPNTYVGNSFLMPDFRKHFRLAKLNRSIWQWYFMKPEQHEIEYEITGDKYMAMWLHLYHHEKNNGFIDDSHIGINTPWLKYKLPVEFRNWLKER